MVKLHQEYGVKPHHYNPVGVVLLWALQKGVGDEWNDEVRSAWVNCYSILCGTMITFSNK